VRFVPYPDLDGIPTVVVDGARHADTLLTLSHWPHSGTPPALKDDLSAQIAFRYLDSPEWRVDAEVVSNNHFDEDGLASVYALVDPDGAQQRRNLVVDVAAAGDFGTFRSRNAARISIAISAFADADRSPLDPAVFALPYEQYAAAMYEEMLPRVEELLDYPDRFRELWAEEDAHLALSEAGLRDHFVALDEVPEIDLAVVTVPEGWMTRQVHRFTQPRSQSVHPMAVHNATARFRVLLVEGRRYEVQFRYESWVQYVSRRPFPRVDLTPLAKSLTADEASGHWIFDGAGAIAPSLHLDGASESSISPEAFRSRVEEFLRDAPGAWDPYDAGE
jgi:Family of unknown function (DUF6687)